jgi:hypothetical protein
MGGSDGEKIYTQNGTDPDLKEFARHTLPKIVDHLQRVKKHLRWPDGPQGSCNHSLL